MNNNSDKQVKPRMETSKTRAISVKHVTHLAKCNCTNTIYTYIHKRNNVMEAFHTQTLAPFCSIFIFCPLNCTNRITFKGSQGRQHIRVSQLKEKERGNGDKVGN